MQAQVHLRHSVAQIQQHCDVNQAAWARFNQACILGFIVHTTRSTLLVYNITKVAVLIDLSLFNTSSDFDSRPYHLCTHLEAYWHNHEICTAAHLQFQRSSTSHQTGLVQGVVESRTIRSDLRTLGKTF